jgi:eukaryotic-like serine/threonine-protein kinase
MSHYQFGPYLLAHRLATGGMGEVFLAARTGPQGFYRPVVLKLLLPHLAQNREYVAMFEAEAAIVARLNHPNIVQVVDVGAVEGRAFIGFEWIPGAGVDRLLVQAKKTQTPIEEACIEYIAREMLFGLSHAHCATDFNGKPLGLVHRDISPSNVLLSVNGEVKVSDFGIAKTVHSETVTKPGDVRGKVAYLAPELLTGQRATQQSDVYAVGLVLARLAIAHLAVEETTERPGRMAAYVQRLRPGLVGSALIKAIEGATEPLRERRFPTAANMLQLLPAGDRDGRRDALAKLLREWCSVEIAAPAEALERLSHSLRASSRGDGPGTTSNVIPLPVHRTLSDANADRATGGLERDPAAGMNRTRFIPLAVMGLVGFAVGGLGFSLYSKPAATAAEPLTMVAAPVEAPTPIPIIPPAVASPVVPREEAANVVSPSTPVVAAPMPAPTAKVKKPKRQASTAPVNALTPVHEKAETKKTETKNSDAAFGTPARLTVVSEPWAYVEIDGVPVGQTPMQNHPLVRGTVALRLTRPGFRPQTVELKVVEGEQVRRKFSLVPEGG